MLLSFYSRRCEDSLLLLGEGEGENNASLYQMKLTQLLTLVLYVEFHSIVVLGELRKTIHME